MKITILGRGNAGCISALHLAYFRKFIDSKVEIDLIYDSNILPVPTGQGTTLDFPAKLFQNFNADVLNVFPHTTKLGIMYENWSKKNKNFFHPFPLGKYAIHIEPKAFQDYVCNNLKINFKQKNENIKNYNGIDSDYIIDCRGKPDSLKEYNKLVNPLNCALLAELPPKKNDVKWTKATAHKHGWCFYIPLPTKTSLGYLFNSNITSVEEATNNFKKEFKIKKVNKVFPFEQYVAKNPIIDKRILLNGNKLFFLEPLEATAMGSYNFTIKCYYDYIFNGQDAETTKLRIIDYVTKIQDFILWQYKTSKFYKNKFWKHASDLYDQHDTRDIEKLFDIVKCMSEEEVRKSVYDDAYYAQWQRWNLKMFLNSKTTV